MDTKNIVADPYASLTVQNVIASSALDQEIDLASVAADLSDAEFDPDRFPGLIYRPKTAEATCLIFRSGKVTCTGGRSAEAAHETIQATVDALRKLGIDAERIDITVQNVVLDADLGEALNLEAIAIGLGLEDVEYEPEQFPGLIYRPDESNGVVLLFGTGKLVITGIRTRDKAEAVLETVVSRLSDLSLLSWMATIGTSSGERETTRSPQ
ncbi:TATA-box-binding protein [Halococcus sediminicola]|uniref:TATA-box-binding protein n=1 Tax=Halococcus sediminicola TaxID=1264579 RepID=UPI000679061E|nr:TATA-box-binding protein [Halococcus sediminicola]